MEKEIEAKIKAEAETEYPIWPNKFKDKDEWLPEEIKKLERRAFGAGAKRGYELGMEEDKKPYGFIIEFNDGRGWKPIYQGQNKLLYITKKSAKEIAERYKNNHSEMEIRVLELFTRMIKSK